MDITTKDVVEGNRRFRVNVLHKGKERWKYCRTIKRAKFLRDSAAIGGLSSIVFEKVGNNYVAQPLNK